MDTIALITGANKGIGFATARLLGERGMRVLLGARDIERGRKAEAELRADGLDATFVRLDVTDEVTITEAAAFIAEQHGHLDVLVNNAAIGGAFAKASDTTVGDLRTVFETNVFGIVAVTNALLPLLRKAPAARIVNVSSEVGSIASMTDVSSPLWQLGSITYPASKSAVNMISAMYAKELRETPIKVNAANPGYCATDFNGNSGFRTAEEGASVAVELATLGNDGVNGVLWGYQMTADQTGGNGVLPW